jgi:transcriptional regulator with XRE-family HTH domain
MAPRRHRLAQRRKALGFTQEGLAERLGVHPATVRRWESGDIDQGPQPWLRPELARCLQVSSDELDDLLAVHRTDHTGADERSASAWSEPAPVDLVTVAALREQVHRLGECYDRVPSISLIAETGECLGQIAHLGGHARRSRVRRDLYALESETATLMGQLVWDASQRRGHAAANCYFDRAIEAARQICDPAAEALAVLRKSFVALYGEKDPRSGLTLTRQAADAARGTSDVLTGLAVLHAAEAHAMLGHREECARALGVAGAKFDRIGVADPALPMFSPTHHGRLAGSCYLFLGRPAQAQRTLEAVAREHRDSSKSQAIVLANLGLAYLHQRQLDGATAILHRAIDVIELTRGGGALNIVFGACRELQSWRHVPDVQDVCDRALALMTPA